MQERRTGCASYPPNMVDRSVSAEQNRKKDQECGDAKLCCDLEIGVMGHEGRFPLQRGIRADHGLEPSCTDPCQRMRLNHSNSSAPKPSSVFDRLLIPRRGIEKAVHR